MVTAADLLPLDVLLFARKSVFGDLIEHASKTPFTHVETYLGDGKTAASRDGKGVATYELDLEGIAVVLRPKEAGDLSKLLAYHTTTFGLPYAWKGLFDAFVKLDWNDNEKGMWCSEKTTHDQRAAGLTPFAPDVPATMISPGDFFKSPAYVHVWVKDGLEVWKGSQTDSTKQ